MRTDRYTRVVLTIIAICLIWLCLRDGAAPAQAGTPTDVRIIGIRKGYDWDPIKTQ